jgi:hypothetical protein
VFGDIAETLYTLPLKRWLDRSPMVWPPEDRHKFLSALDATESKVLVFFKYLLYFLIASVTFLAVVFYHSITKDAFRDFLRLYGSILYLIFLAWAVGQLFAIRGRQSRGPSDSNAPSTGDPTMAMRFTKAPETGARGFFFQFGAGSQSLNDSAKTVGIGFSASSIADEDKLDESSAAQADGYISAGATLDFASRMVNPRYKDWSPPQQGVYRAYLQGQIELRKTPASQANEPFSSAPACESRAENTPPEATRFPSSEAETHKSRQPLCTFGLVMIFFVFLAIMAAAMLVGLFFARGAK